MMIIIWMWIKGLAGALYANCVTSVNKIIYFFYSFELSLSCNRDLSLCTFPKRRSRSQMVLLSTELVNDSASSSSERMHEAQVETTLNLHHLPPLRINAKQSQRKGENEEKNN